MKSGVRQGLKRGLLRMEILVKERRSVRKSRRKRFGDDKSLRRKDRMRTGETLRIIQKQRWGRASIKCSDPRSGVWKYERMFRCCLVAVTRNELWWQSSAACVLAYLKTERCGTKMREFTEQKRFGFSHFGDLSAPERQLSHAR